MAAARASKKKPPPRSAPPKKLAKKKPGPKRPLADSRGEALAWFHNLSTRISHAGVPELQVLISEARNYDLIGLGEALGNDAEVLALNQAANDLIAAGLDTFGAASPQGFQLQVLRDILNDS